MFTGVITKVDIVSKELLMKGRHIFMGYMYMPKETAACFDAEDYFHTGDVAEFDQESRYNSSEIRNTQGPTGFMKIVGRIKDIIISAGGENIPPVIIEEEVKKQTPVISNCVGIGDCRKYLVMLLTIKTVIPADGVVTGDALLAPDVLEIGRTLLSQSRTLNEFMADPLWSNYVNECVAVANRNAISNAQVIQKWKILPTELSEAQGHLTPTLKLKRNVINHMYKDEINELYNDVFSPK